MKSLTATIIVTGVTLMFTAFANNTAKNIEDAGNNVQTSRQQQMEELQRLGL